MPPRFDAPTYLLASSVKDATPPDGKVWNWWDRGYLFQQAGHRKTFIDGGLQTPARAYAAAVPLANGNVSVSHYWIRFFSEHPDAIDDLARHAGSKRNAVDFLLKVFNDPDKLPGLVSEYKLPQRNWKGYLFPNVKVTLALLSDMLVRSTWLSIGRSLPGTPLTPASIYVMPFSQCIVDTDHDEITYQDRTIQYSAIYQITTKQLSNSPGKSGESVAVAVPRTDKLFYMDTDQFDCLVFRLLFVNPQNTPGFRLVVYNPFIGGVWIVE